MAARAQVIEAFRSQVEWCGELGSPFTARLLEYAVADLESDGPLAEIIGDWPGDPRADALPLRFAGALHALVLSGAAPNLAAAYPPKVTKADPAKLWPAVLAAIASHRAHIDAYLASPPQTNEVRRSAVLLGGFLEIARATRQPLRLFEIGASAGLNSAWDRYRYALGDAAWGDPQSPVLVSTAWKGPLPPLAAPIAVAARAASDRAPIDIEDPVQHLRLRAYVWPDQRERLALLEGASDTARRIGIRVEQADAATWVEMKLGETAPGEATVLYHSIMWQYLPAETKARIEATVSKAATAATHKAPFAWLRFEPPAPGERPELRLTLWPGGEIRRLARAHPHGTTVTWLAS